MEGFIYSAHQPKFHSGEVIIRADDTVEQFAADTSDRDDGYILCASSSGNLCIGNLHLTGLWADVVLPPAFRCRKGRFVRNNVLLIGLLQLFIRTDAGSSQPLIDGNSVGTVDGTASRTSRQQIVRRDAKNSRFTDG